MKNCELCGFNNPKATVTAVIIKDGKLLFLRRAEEPFKGVLDLPGGYMSAGEKPEAALARELKEELGVGVKFDFIGFFPGNGNWKGEDFPILSLVYLAELEGEINLDTKENSECVWVKISELKSDEIAFDSNRDIIKYVKNNFDLDFSVLKNLINQLDSSAEVKEMNLYRSLLSGYMAKKYDNGRLIGAGWIFPRRTFLRKQAVVEDMIVADSERGKGYGKELVLDLMKWAGNNGVEVVELTSGSHRIAANKLYQSVGFKLHPTNHYLFKTD